MTTYSESVNASETALNASYVSDESNVNVSSLDLARVESLIQMETELTVSKDVKMKINLQGCVNTLKYECK